jgi:hypothetical protein
VIRVRESAESPFVPRATRRKIEDLRCAAEKSRSWETAPEGLLIRGSWVRVPHGSPVFIRVFVALPGDLLPSLLPITAPRTFTLRGPGFLVRYEGELAAVTIAS